MRPIAVYDTECYPNYYLVSFLDVQSGRIKSFEIRDGVEFDTLGIKKILKVYTVVGFNCLRYDHLVLSAALAGRRDLKQISDNIINLNMMPWTFEEKYGVDLYPMDQIDLINVAPGMVSLKTYGGRMHSKTLWDLPYEPSATLTGAQMDEVRDYCNNDLMTTLDLWNYLHPQIELRNKMSKIYNIDLRSKSDAQIAEAVIGKQLRERGVNVQKPKLDKNYTFKYEAPKYLKGKLNGLVDEVEALTFKLTDTGSVATPDALKDKIVKIGQGEYRMGIGGLHSSEEGVAIDAGDMVLEDRDVASYYPSLIINNRYYPAHLGMEFLKVYAGIYKQRLTAKHSGDKVTSDVMKITLNGTFGKLGSKWSIFYSPDMLIQVTLTGQLCLLWLIDELEKENVRVVSANTDGIVLYYHPHQRDIVNGTILDWEKATKLLTEATPYKSIHNRDVNSYINVKEKGVKTKGAYALDAISKNPHGDIATIAVIDYLTSGMSIDTTIMTCRDITKFIFLRKVEGGAVKNDKYLGRVVRWYYAVGEDTPILYKKNGNKVSESEGGKPIMTLPETFPDDVDYNKYIQMGYSILKDVGVKNVCTS